MPDFNSENWFPAIELLSGIYAKKADKRFVYVKEDAFGRQLSCKRYT